MAYDFRSLSPRDFEFLCRDLLTRREGVPFETFRAGSDQGIDCRSLRHGTTIAQCKHRVESGYGRLKAHLAREERPKVNTMRPDRYILLTSVPLSAANKSELRRTFSPFVLSDDDILGADDLNGLLRDHPEVERQHYKLWLTSASVMERLLHSDVYARTARRVDQLEDSARLYVQNRSFREAKDRLKSYRLCVIAGPPGIGKTMLADMLLLDHVGRGYEPVVITRDLSDADRLFHPDKPQLFLYDDFLGKTKLSEQFDKNEDAHLLEFMAAVNKTRGKRLVLTTREYILQEARLRYETLDQADLSIYKVVLDLGRYTRLERAEILCNHLYFSALPPEALASVAQGKQYHRIIAHRNYNPRLIRRVTELAISEDRKEHFALHMLQTLDNPRDLWGHIFTTQLNAHEQCVLLALVSFRHGPLIDRLFNAYGALMSSSQRGTASRWEFERALKALEGTFLDIDEDEEGHVVELRDPSVRDYLLYFLDEHANDVAALVNSIEEFDQMLLLWGYGQTSPQEAAQGVASHQGIAAALVQHQDAVAATVLRTLGAPTSNTRGMSADVRLLGALQFLPSLQGSGVLDWVRHTGSERSKKWANETDKSVVVRILQAVAALPDEIGESFEPIVREGKAACVENLSSPDDYRTFVSLTQAVPSLVEVDEVTRARDEFVNYAENEIAHALAADTVDGDALFELYQDIDYLSNRFGVSVYGFDQLESFVHEVMPEEDEDWEPDEESPLRVDVETLEIESMFNELIQIRSS